MTRADGRIGVDASATLLYPGGVSAFTLPNAFPSATLFSQVHVMDVGSPFPIALANTDGRTATVPNSNLTRVVQVTRLFNNTGGTTATSSLFFPTSSVGHGIVTRFTY